MNNSPRNPKSRLTRDGLEYIPTRYPEYTDADGYCTVLQMAHGMYNSHGNCRNCNLPGACHEY